MTVFGLVEAVREEVANNNTEKALNLLNSPILSSDILTDVIIRTAQNNGLAREVIRGTISYKDANITRNQIHNAILSIADQINEKQIRKTKIFISYNREPNSSALAQSLRAHFKSQGFQLFMDIEDTPVGADWAKTILQEINSCDYFILLLSQRANSSEMVIKEVEEASCRLKKEGSPKILPIRVDFPVEERLNARLHSLLYRTQQIEWSNKSDSEKVISRIEDVIYERVTLVDTSLFKEEAVENFVRSNNVPPTPVAALEVPRGAVRLESKFYVKRPQEDSFIRHVDSPGAILRIRGPRQFGKTSLLTRVMAHAAERQYNIIAIDFQELDEETMKNLDTLLWEFCCFFAEEFDLEDELDKYWSRSRSRKQVSTSFIEKEILRKQDEPLLLALDEADRLFRYTEVSTEFFLLLRSWHEKSKVPNRKEWEKFRLALSYSTEAKLAIQDLNASPFNVGEEAKLVPFTNDQVIELMRLHGINWTPDQLNDIMTLLAGQPYLVRRALYLLAKGEYPYQPLIDNADKHDGPFSDHLRHHLINLKQYDEAVEAMQEIIARGRCNDPIMATRLEATGLVKGSPPNMEPANGLYATYFKGKL